MPLQRPQIRLITSISGHPDALPMEGHIWLTVIKIVLETMADHKAAVRGHCDVTRIEEPVNVCAEEKAIVEAVLTSLANRPNVSSVQHRQSFLASNGTPAPIIVGDQSAEGTLS
jgi:hypothetical protein